MSIVKLNNKMVKLGGKLVTLSAPPETVTDYDNNVYDVVTIGTQKWTTQNLKTTHYNDGTVIPNLTTDSSWITATTGGYCWYGNNISYKEPYGALYNWHAISNIHGIAPTGWRVPTNTDWTTLITYAGGDSVAGGKLKEVGLTHWNPNVDATDDYGFAAVGGGDRNFNDGTFEYMNLSSLLWSSTDIDTYTTWVVFINGGGTIMSLVDYYDKLWGGSIRLVKI